MIALVIYFVNNFIWYWYLVIGPSLTDGTLRLSSVHQFLAATDIAFDRPRTDDS
jgi:hypothetical protein